MKVLLLSRYGRLAPSSRLRCYQYLPYLESAGISVESHALFDDAYVASLYETGRRKSNVIFSYYTQLRRIISASKFDVLWFEKELLPWIPAWVELGALDPHIPVVVDYDDAIFHRYDQHRAPVVRALLGKKINSIMRRASVVIVGNDYLRKHAEFVGARKVELLPTVVDLRKYLAVEPDDRATNGEIVIGWIGNPGTARYLEAIADSIREVQMRAPVPVLFRAIGANPDQVSGMPIEAQKWSEITEAVDVARLDVGIMPLPDEPFERGKCGYKLIQYMACGKPVIASPVGANRSIVESGVSGFLASSSREWVDAMLWLCEDARLRSRMGRAGRLRVEKEFSLQVTAPKMASIFLGLAS